ncbi:MAG: glycosyltransferase family 2 protein [Gemmataceae bacterium]|uniref:Glycosyltransferase n=1 Tax=Thermogemmata fonticola TaxID=2755323 RepID=A0A7V8VD64_9BACT|nr:glycosyltransferase [Thermogemmata fonticola]MBA2225840.1 glycosyltransferase [Thermogemmata fonticola]MCX8140650.1 glycosyltransferase family 2 protein [Gemmataceae bacterium]
MSLVRGRHCRYSVLLPLEGDRNTLGQAIQAWQNQQGQSPLEVELILVTADVKAAVQARQRWPTVHILQESNANLSRLYDLAARAATGDVLIFTEAHCLPATDFLHRLQTVWEDLPCAGITAHIRPVCPNRLAEMDARLWEEGWCKLVCTPGEWRRFNVQGTALRRDIYLQLGGLPYQYDRFAEMLFAAQLRDAGYTIAYSSKLIMQHIFRGNLRDYISDIFAYVGGENRYRREIGQADQPGHSYVFPLPRDAHKEALLRELVQTLLRDLVGRGLWQRDGITLRLLRYAWLLWWNHGYRLLFRYRWQGRGAVVRCHLWRWLSRSRLEAAYRELWPSWSRFLRLADLLRDPPVPAEMPPECRFPAAAWPEELQCGLYAQERAEGQAFCWTGPLAVFRLPPSECPRKIELELLASAAPPHLEGIRVWYNGRRLPWKAIHYQRPRLSLFVPPVSASPCLILGCLPLQPWRYGVADSRELGLPVVTVSLQRENPAITLGHLARAA